MPGESTPISETSSASAKAAGVDVEALVVKRQLAAALEAKLAAIRRDALPFYKPHAKQDAFHRSTASRRGVFTGNRFGKSHMGMSEDAAWLRGERVWYPKDDPSRVSGIPQRPVKGLLIANDWDKVDEIFTNENDGKLWRALPTDGFIKSTARNHAGVIAEINCANRSVLRFDTVQSYKTNPQGLESSDWDFIHVDEPCPIGMFKAASRGLIDRGGYAWFTLTAIAEPWITDAFEPDGLFSALAPFVVEGDIWDNPYLSSKAIDEYAATLTPDEVEARLYGKPLHKAGLIYKSFQRDKHVLSTLPTGWRSWIEPPESWSYYAYIDPHPRTPHCVLFVTVDPLGTIYVYHDIFDHCLISELCAQVRTIMGKRRFVRIRVDPIAFIEDPVHGTCMAQEFWACGLAVEKASKDLPRGILRVQECLAKPCPLVYFTPSCRRTIWEFGKYRWDEETNKPVDVDDHAMECLYRCVLDEPRYIDQKAMHEPLRDEDFLRRMPSLNTEAEPLKWNEVTLTRDDLMLN